MTSSNVPAHSSDDQSPLLAQTRALIRARHMSIRTERTYLNWIERFLRFHRQRRGRWVHPAEMSDAHINEFLTALAVEGNVAAGTQNQALSAILFLFKRVLSNGKGQALFSFIVFDSWSGGIQGADAPRSPGALAWGRIAKVSSSIF